MDSLCCIQFPGRAEHPDQRSPTGYREGNGFSVEGDVVAPATLSGGVFGGAEAGEGVEVVGEVGLVVVAAVEG